MTFAEWLNSFRQLHDKAKKGRLSGREFTDYHAARDELARALLAAQRIALKPGQRPRRVLRVTRALQADLEFHDGSERAMTLDVSTGGFRVLLGKPPRMGDEAKVSLRIDGGEPIRGSARVVEVKRQVGNAYACFEFVGLDATEAERLESFVFDAVLELLKS
jgi:hypothetical protein